MTKKVIEGQFRDVKSLAILVRPEQTSAVRAKDYPTGDQYENYKNGQTLIISWPSTDLVLSGDQTVYGQS